MIALASDWRESTPVQTRDCKKCGASLQIEDEATSVACRYCGTVSYAQSGPERRADNTVARGARRGKSVLAAVFAVVSVLGGGALATFLSFTRATGSRGVENMAQSVSQLVTGLQAATGAGGTAGSRVLFDDVGGSPVWISNSSGTHLAFRVRYLDERDQLGMVMISGTTCTETYQSARLLSYSEAYRSVKFGAVGRFLVYADARDQLHVLDTDTRTERLLAALPTRVEAICPREAGELTVVTDDGRNWLVNPVTGDPQPVRHGSRTACSPSHQGRGPNGMNVSVGWSDRADPAVRVAVGLRSAGHRVPVIGFFAKDPKAAEISFLSERDPVSIEERAPEYLDVFQGKALTHYSVKNTEEENRVVLFDVATHARVWDIAPRPIFAVDRLAGMSIGPDGNLYVGRMSSVELYKVQDGTLVCTFGSATYDP